MHGAIALKCYAKYVASFGLAFPCAISAVGLGSLHVGSSLNQPLKARIDLSLDKDTVISGVKVRLASSDAFKKAGMERPYRLSKLSFSATMVDGKPVILITSQRRMNDPFLSVLLDVTWAKGQIYRAYTILLDPPGYEMASVRVSNTSFKRNQAAYRKQRRKVAKKIVSKKAFVASNGVYGPTKSTDDLWDIALRYKPENASMNQVMLGIMRLNPKAFINGNINKLKKGVMLKLPSAQTVMLIDKKTALTEVQAHATAWKNKQSLYHVVDLSAMPKEEVAEEVIEEEIVNENAAAPEAASSELNNEQSPKSEDVGSEKNQTQPTNTSEASNPQVTADKPLEATQKLAQEKIQFNMVKPAEKEPLFDDFIDIPPVLKKIVKPHGKRGENSASVEKTMLQPRAEVVNKPVAQVAVATPNMNAEVAVAVSAIEAVKESNQLLRQQVEGLLKQNALLKQQITALSVQDDKFQRQIDALMKAVAKDYVISKDGTLTKRAGVTQDGSSVSSGIGLAELLGLLAALIVLAMGGVFAFIYFNQKNKKVADVDDEMMALYNKEHIGEEFVAPENHTAADELVRSSEEPDVLEEEDAVDTASVKQYNQAVISVSKEIVTQETETPKATEAKVEEIEEVENGLPLTDEKLSKKETSSELTPPKEVSEQVKQDKAQQPQKEQAKGEFDLLDLEFEYTDEKQAIAEKKKETPVAEVEEKEDAVVDKAESKDKGEFDLLDLEFEYTDKDKKTHPSLEEEIQLEAATAAAADAAAAAAADAAAAEESAKEAPVQLEAEIITTTDETQEKELDLSELSLAPTGAESEDVAKSPKSKVETEDKADLSAGDGLSLVDTKAPKEVEKQPEPETAVAETVEPPQEKVNISTQIALAETYIAMEDWQSANESLELAIKEGNEAQVARAKKLMKKLPK